MADRVRKVDYFSMTVSDKPGEGLKALKALAEASVNLLAFTGFPTGKKAQVDFVPDDAKAFKKLAKKQGWKVNPAKTAFLIEGTDRPGVLIERLDRLAQAKINVTAMDAVIAGEGRYGVILWVKPDKVAKAAKLLGVESMKKSKPPAPASDAPVTTE